jgi:hypothetical protein
MSKFTSVESNRVLSLLSEVLEKLHLLASIPEVSIDADANHATTKAQRLLLSRLEKEPAYVLENQVRLHCFEMHKLEVVCVLSHILFRCIVLGRT